MWQLKLGATCGGIRYHMREYISQAPAGDSHSPTFNGYAGMPVHWENDAHENVNPKHGQDQLFADIRANHHVVDYHSVFVPNNFNDCTNCFFWEGKVEFYEVSGQTAGGDFKNCDGISTTEFSGGGIPWIRFTCVRNDVVIRGP